MAAAAAGLMGTLTPYSCSYAIDPAAACCFWLNGCAYGERSNFRRIIVVLAVVRDLGGDWFDSAAMVVVVLVGYATVI